MIALYIIFGILVFITLILVIPLRVKIYYAEEVNLTVHYLFLKFTILPESKKKPEPKKAKKKSVKKTGERSPNTNKIFELIKQKGFRNFLSLITELTILIGSSLKAFVSHLKIREMDVYVVAASEDAASAALIYGEACAIVYPAISILAQIGRCSSYGVSVDLNYKEKEPSVLAHVTFSILPVFVVKEGIKLLFKGIPYIKEFI